MTRGFAWFLLLVALLLPTAAPRADDSGKPQAAPRAVVTIGDASIVLVAAPDRLVAYVDRIADNAPITDAALKLRLKDGDAINLAKATTGLFTGPYTHKATGQDKFILSLTSADGTGDAEAVIDYADGPDQAVSTTTAPALAGRLLLAAILALLAVCAVAMVRWQQKYRRKGA